MPIEFLVDILTALVVDILAILIARWLDEC
jgi:hypothetical protein